MTYRSSITYVEMLLAESEHDSKSLAAYPTRIVVKCDVNVTKAGDAPRFSKKKKIYHRPLCVFQKNGFFSFNIFCAFISAG